MSTHTPGPWKVFWAEGKRHMFIGIGAMDGEGVTDPHFNLWGGTEEQAAANARLIAAAPDLLAACRWAESALAPFSKDPAEKSGIALLRAAIAKATGTE